MAFTPCEIKISAYLYKHEGLKALQKKATPDVNESYPSDFWRVLGTR
jgi:hypothetical protein